MKPVIIKRWDSDDLTSYHYTSNASDEHSDDLFIVASFIEDIGPTKAPYIEEDIRKIRTNEMKGISFNQSRYELKDNNIHLNYLYDDNLSDVIMSKEEFFKFLDQWFDIVKKLPKEIVLEKTDTGSSIHPKEGTTFWTPPKDMK